MATTDLVAVLPTQLARYFAGLLPLQLYELPFHLGHIHLEITSLAFSAAVTCCMALRVPAVWLTTLSKVVGHAVVAHSRLLAAAKALLTARAGR